MIVVILLMAAWFASFAGRGVKFIASDNDMVITDSRIVKVSNAVELQHALDNARPGDSIVLKDGVYSGRFVIPVGVNGTNQSSITLSGGRDAVLDGGDIQSGYVLHIQSGFWTLRGFTIRNGMKGVMADGVNNVLMEGLFVTNIGDEAIHLRKFSSHNVVQHCEITYTGLKTPGYGEGIYIGTAKSNWSSVTNGEIDKCDSNKVLGNKIGPFVAAECIDVKEGTTGGIIAGNNFDAKGIQGANSADSWIDVKGNHYIIENNTGDNSPRSALTDGYQVNVAYNGWGNYNEFKNNTCNVNAAGYAVNIRLRSSNGEALGNKVYTGNKVKGALKGLSNIPLTDQ